MTTRVLPRRSAGRRSDTATQLWQLLRAQLPEGRSLPVAVWQRRHRVIVAVLWLHALAIVCWGIVGGFGLGHSLSEGGLVVAAALLASWPRLGRDARTALATLGLLTASAVLVHLSGGLIEMHFHFFVMLGLIALYQDWLPFLLSLAYVVLHHGAMGVLTPQSVYSHPGAWAHPWRWAAIHGGFVLAASVINLLAWRVSERAFQDPLTRLANLTLFRQRLERALTPSSRPRQLAVLFLDLDDFKTVNDSLGHTTGNALIIAVGERLRGCVRPGDTVARLGGDEFALLLTDLPTPQRATQVAEWVLTALQAPCVLPEAELFVSASIGIVVRSAGQSSVDDLLRDADVAMYRAKGQGKGGYALFEPQMHAQVQERWALKADLQRALARQEFVLHYQPIVELATGEVTEVEALVRWQHPQRGLMHPASFIPLAEEGGLIIAVGRWVLAEACAQVRHWQDRYPGRPPLALSVNLSPREFADPGLVAAVAAVLRESGLEPARLRLEITEGTLMQDEEETRAALVALRALGVSLALDDFGTGYSSLSYLRRFPVDTLKLDRSFVQALDEDGGTVAIVEAVTTLAHALGMAVTAEGVESPAQLAQVQALACDSAQGDYLAPPLAPDALAALLAGGGTRHAA